LRFGGSIPARLLGAGSVMLLVCGIASGQTSSARLIPVSSSSTSHKTKNIDPARAREIQEALIREHYMEGSPSGTWDANSQNAMVRFQADNGWQSKVVPDSRALIKLGLGPDHEHLLNPESAMTSQPESPRVSPMLNQTPAVVIPPQK
jgi:hypothetical protein